MSEKVSSSLKNFFVKFIPYRDEATLYYLQNKLIRFSTVYDFNDFNELHYTGIPKDWLSKKINAEIIAKFSDNEYKCDVYKKLYDSGLYYRAYLKGFKKRLDNFFIKKEEKFEDTDYYSLQEHLAFSSVGIFCTSSLKVFCDDSAQLMFAHYGGNLKGLALIYEIDEDPLLPTFAVHYSPCEKAKECEICEYVVEVESSINLCDQWIRKNRPLGEANRLEKWIDGDFKEVKDFLIKSKKWEYEKEYRVFCTPGIKKTTEVGMELKAILYTPRVTKEHVENLKETNQSVYKGELKIQEIRPSHAYYRFDISDDRSSHPVVEWLNNEFLK